MFSLPQESVYSPNSLVCLSVLLLMGAPTYKCSWLEQRIMVSSGPMLLQHMSVKQTFSICKIFPRIQCSTYFLFQSVTRIFLFFCFQILIEYKSLFYLLSFEGRRWHDVISYLSVKTVIDIRRKAEH